MLDFLNPPQLLRLCAIVAADLDKQDLVNHVLLSGEQITDYYQYAFRLVQPSKSRADFVETFFCSNSTLETLQPTLKSSVSFTNADSSSK